MAGNITSPLFCAAAKINKIRNSRARPAQRSTYYFYLKNLAVAKNIKLFFPIFAPRFYVVYNI